MVEVFDIYHDESKEESYWHGFLFVPRTSKQYLVDLLFKARDNIGWQRAISFKEIGNRQGIGSPKIQLVHSWLTIGVSALQQQKFVTLPTPIYLGGKPAHYLERLDRPILCKFVVFREKDRHKKMFSGLSELDCIEITFRMGIKGGIHRLFSESQPISVGNIFIDGDEHYVRNYGRRFDINQSIRRFALESRPYVSFTKGAKLIPQRSDHRRIAQWQNPADSQLLQLCDVLLGGIRHHSYCPDSRSSKYRLSWPCRTLLERDTSNLSRMIQSRFFNGFTLSEAWLDGQEWQFDSLKLGKDKALPNIEQLKWNFPD